MALWRYLGILFATMAVLYLLCLGATYAFFDEGNRRIDTVAAENDDNLFQNTPRYFLYNLNRLDHSGRRVVVIGASATAYGLRPDELEPMAGVPVHNISIYASNMRETRETVDLAYAHIPKADWPRTTFVLGLWYAQLISNAQRWPGNATEIDVEGTRFGLYRQDGLGRLVPNWGPRLMPLLEVATRPAVLFAKIYYAWVSPSIDAGRLKFGNFMVSLGQAKPAFSDITHPPAYRYFAARNSFDLGPHGRDAAIFEWTDYMGPADHRDDSALQDLVALAHDISAHGSRLVIVDLPLPTWLKARVPFVAEYDKKLADAAASLSRDPHVTFKVMGAMADDTFQDAAHPRPRATPAWSKAVVPWISRD
jgi:hypothetical protein